MGEKELKEKLEGINLEIQSTQKDIDSINQTIKKKIQQKEFEKAIRERIQQALELLKSLKDQRDEKKKELSKEWFCVNH